MRVRQICLINGINKFTHTARALNAQAQALTGLKWCLSNVTDITWERNNMKYIAIEKSLRSINIRRFLRKFKFLLKRSEFLQKPNVIKSNDYLIFHMQIFLVFNQSNSVYKSSLWNFECYLITGTKLFRNERVLRIKVKARIIRMNVPKKLVTCKIWNS